MENRDDFYELLKRVERAAFHYGTDNRPMREALGNPFVDAKHQREFMKACHRGFDKAQRTVVEMLNRNRVDESIDETERERRELLLRKIIDGILFTMVGMQTWVTRRVVLHDEPPALDLKIIAKALSKANEINSADRYTFAVVADLSTFVHICDLVQVLPLERGKLKFIELKKVE